MTNSETGNPDGSGQEFKVSDGGGSFGPARVDGAQPALDAKKGIITTARESASVEPHAVVRTADSQIGRRTQAPQSEVPFQPSPQATSRVEKVIVALPKKDEGNEVSATVPDPEAASHAGGETTDKPTKGKGTKGMTPEDAARVRSTVFDLSEGGQTYAALAEQYGVSTTTIENWLQKERTARGVTPEIQGTRNMDAEQAALLRATVLDQASEGKTYAELAEKYNVSPSTIKSMLRQEREERGEQPLKVRRSTPYEGDELTRVRSEVWEQSMSETDRKTHDYLAAKYGVSRQTIGKWMREEREKRNPKNDE